MGNLPVSRSRAKELGESRYFTGKPCKRGHLAERITANATCVQCCRSDHAAWCKTWRANNPKLARSRVQESKRNHPETAKSYRIVNCEKKKAADKAWRASQGPALHERRKPYFSRYKEQFPEKLKSAKARWKRDNPEAVQAHTAKRRAMKIAAGGSFTAQEIRVLFDKQGGRCANVKCQIVIGPYHIDHVLPVRLNGSSEIDNIQLLCPACNLRKGSKPPDAWARDHHPLPNTDLLAADEGSISKHVSSVTQSEPLVSP